MTFDQGQPFEIREEQPAAAAMTMRLYGEFDLAGTGRFEAALERIDGNGISELVIDLGGVTFIDSSAIRALLGAKARADEDSFQLFVVGELHGQVRDVLELTGVDRILRPDSDPA